MAPLAEAAVEAIELDVFAKKIADEIPYDTTFYGMCKNNMNVVPIPVTTAAGGTTRPSFKVPLRLQSGAAITQGTGNGDSLGRGTGSQWGSFALSPVFFFNVCEITYLAKLATRGKDRALFSVQAQELTNSLQQAKQGLEGLMQGDGSGAYEQIPATATVLSASGGGSIGTPTYSQISGLSNAFQFSDQQVIQVFPTIGGSTRGSFTISYVDPVSNTIYCAAALPSTGGATAVGDYLVVAGASGAAGGSILGLKAWQVNSNSGTIGGLNRANYPGRLSTPTINLGGAALSLSTGRRALVLLGRALGADNPAIESGLWYTGPGQAMQISNLYYNALLVNAMEAKGEKTPDMVKKYWPETFTGIPLHVGWTAAPGRLDLIAMKTWHMGELQELTLYDFGGGNTVAPVPDIVNGGYLTSHMFSYTASFQLCNGNPRAGCFITSAGEPTI